MIIKSYGDRLTKGKYKVHSKFKKAINFVNAHNPDEILISLVNEKTGSGPFNIVVARYDRIPANHILSLEITSDSFLIKSTTDAEVVKMKDAQKGRYNSNIHKTFENKNIALNIFEHFVLKMANKKSMVFLLDEKRKNNSNSAFEKELINRIQNGVENLYTSGFDNGIDKLRGVGFGLTPSGDDFLAGVLYALNAEQRPTRQDTKRLINKIYREAKGENPFSNTLLFCAKEGFFFEKLKNLINTLMTTNQKKNEEIEKPLRSLLKTGETSGTDLAIGFLMTIKWRNSWH